MRAGRRGRGSRRCRRRPPPHDGNAGTYWETEHYSTVDFGKLKQGVGLVIDAGKSLRVGSIEIRTGTPGFEAAVKAGDSTSGPFSAVASSTQTVDSRTTFVLHLSSPHRYYVIWITKLTRVPGGSGRTPYAAQIAEVTGN